ncbi:rod shape-determining protein [Paucibacter sp. XJ19-41]|uniref:rod shape-determining protein n=1 Tax=Paucibacter sp. XJ19-41 TaxID=2927824 RepID=UPI00234AB60E|nr:rod shape-determining protein [Paucibacter sp. XJ19-41]MDC6170652.1 rod shape-determining protein [Paucibacter sp. XJ19-41]
MFFSTLKPVLYIQISPERITLKNLKTGELIAEVPEMAITAAPKPTILAVGPQARLACAAQAAQLLNPFAHPRSLVSDFTLAEQLLRYYVHRIRGQAWLSIAPRIVLHPLGQPAGGFTQVERRAFRELASGAGAAEAIVWMGRVLTDEEILTRRFPAGEGEWE